MHTERRNLTWTLMPLFLAGILGNVWKVEYHQQRICAVKGSCVVIPCSFHHPDNQRVNRVMWVPVKSQHFKSNLREVPRRFQYIGDKRHNCSLKIHQVELNDAGKYAIRFITNKKKGGLGGGGVMLNIVDLTVSVTKASGSRTTKEGDSVNLTCINGCDRSRLSSVFTWFKNEEAIYEGAVLYLSNISSTNSGNYSCSLRTHAETTSGAVNIDVEHGPKNTSVLFRQMMEVDAGSNITLICSSHANPPVENYTWFKIDDDDILDVGDQPVIFTGEGGQYLCRATNRHGSQNSSVVTLKMRAYWTTFTRDVLIITTVAVLLIVTPVIALMRLNRKRKWTSKTDCEEDRQNTDYVSWLMCDSNQSEERNQCVGETTEVVYATIDFSKRRKPNMEQQMGSHCDEGVIYSTVCRSQRLTPSYIDPD